MSPTVIFFEPKLYSHKILQRSPQIEKSRCEPSNFDYLLPFFVGREYLYQSEKHFRVLNDPVDDVVVFVYNLLLFGLSDEQFCKFFDDAVKVFLTRL